MKVAFGNEVSVALKRKKKAKHFWPFSFGDPGMRQGRLGGH
jgi:hypothetical protein